MNSKTIQQVDYSSKNMQDLRAARTATEIRRLVDGVKQGISSISTNIRKEIRKAKSMPVRSVSNTIELSDLEAGPKQKKVVKMLNTAIDLDTIDISSARTKAENNQKLMALEQAIAELNVAYQILSSKTFASFKNQGEAARGVRATIEEARVLQKGMIKVMSQDVSKEAPADHRKLAAGFVRYLDSILSKERYSTIKSRTFVAKGTNPIEYQTFLHIKDFENSDGVNYSKYFIVITTRVDILEAVQSHYITSIVDELIPGSFPVGRHVDTLNNGKKAINSLLTGDGFFEVGNRRPIKKTTTQLRDTTALGNYTHNIRGRELEIFDGVRVQNDILYVRLARGLSPAEEKVAVTEASAIASTVLRATRRARTQVTSKVVTARSGRKFVKVILNNSSGANEAMLTLKAVNTIAEMFNMDASQVRILKQSIK